MQPQDKHGQALSIGDCYRYEFGASDAYFDRIITIDEARREARVTPMNETIPEVTLPFRELRQFSEKITCGSCPNTFECLAQGVIKDAS